MFTVVLDGFNYYLALLQNSEKFWYNQKQPPEVFYKKAVLKICNIYRETHVLESLYNEDTGL